MELSRFWAKQLSFANSVSATVLFSTTAEKMCLPQLRPVTIPQKADRCLNHFNHWLVWSLNQNTTVAGVCRTCPAAGVLSRSSLLKRLFSLVGSVCVALPD